MSSHSDEYVVQCWNDCKMEGCPGHKIEVDANNTSNALTYSKDGEIIFGMDFDELGAFITTIYDMRHWVEIDNLFRNLLEREDK